MNIDKNYNVESIASTDAQRDPITLLHVKRNHPVLKHDALEATNGRMYVAVPIEIENGDTGDLIDPSLIKHAKDVTRKALKGVRNRKYLCPDMRIKLRKRWSQTIDKVLRPRVKSGAVKPYPDTTDIFPCLKREPRTVTKVRLNAKYLAKIQDAMNADGVELTLYDEMEVIEVKNAHEPKSMGYGLLVPLRD